MGALATPRVAVLAGGQFGNADSGAGEVYRTISRHLIGKAGLSRATGATGTVTLVQRFGSALNLNVHFHMVSLDGAYQTVGAAAPFPWRLPSRAICSSW